jgi:WD40 repeat protein
MRQRRALSLTADILLLLLAALLGITSNYVTSGQGKTPTFLRVIQHSSVQLLVAALVLTISCRVLLHYLERPERPRPVWNNAQTPFVGLDSYSPSEAAVFFGRDREITELYECLHPKAAPSKAKRILTIAGPSGVGKTSLIMAGLVPRLRRNTWLVVPAFVPSVNPMENLRRSIRQLLPPNADQSPPERSLVRLLSQLRESRSGRPASILIVIDQAEELFTVSGPDTTNAFLDEIKSAVELDARLWIVVSIRADFLNAALALPQAELFTNLYAVGAMSESALFDVIAKPAQLAGFQFEPRTLIDKMVHDTRTGFALPLLSYILQELSLAAGPQGIITAAQYEAKGGVVGALARQADRVYTSLIEQNSAEEIMETLLRFVSIVDGEAVRKRVARSQLSSIEQNIVDAFVEARLMTSYDDENVAMCTVAHEALFEYWSPLSRCIAEQSDRLRWSADLERWAVDWERSGRQEAYLARGERLEFVRKFINDSGMAQDKGLIVEYVQNSEWADAEAMRRLGDAIGQRAINLAGTDPQASLLLALAAVEECEGTTVGRKALSMALSVCRELESFDYHSDAVWGVAWSPDGRWIASTSHDGSMRILDVAAASLVASFSLESDWVRGVAWSPDGRLVASVSRNGTLRLASAPDFTSNEPCMELDSAAFGLAWSPDGRLLAVACQDSKVVIGDIAEARVKAQLSGHGGAVYGVAWHPSGNVLASCSHDETVRLWDVASSSESHCLTGHTDTVWNVAWSPDGELLASVSYDRTIRLWRRESSETTHCLEGHADWIRGLAWSPDSSRIATGSYDRSIKIWDVEAGISTHTFRGHRAAVWGLSWSPDGARLASGGQDQTVRVWAIRDEMETGVLHGHRDGLWGVTWNQSKNIIATSSFDRTARIWDASSCGTIAILTGHDHTVTSIGWSHKGDVVATGSHDGTIKVWTADGREVESFEKHEDTVWGLAWSPNDEFLASTSYDRQVIIWHRPSADQVWSAQLSHVGSSISWSPDGSKLVLGSFDGTVNIIDPFSNPTTPRALRSHSDRVWSVCWSPDSSQIASASQDGTIRIWDEKSGEDTLVLLGHEDSVWAVDWEPHGKRLASGGQDGTVRIWDTSEGSEVSIISASAAAVRGVAWSPDSSAVVSASLDHSARIWNVVTDLNSLIEIAHRRVGRTLTAQEREALGLPRTE